MPTRQQVEEKIIARLMEKTGGRHACSMCGNQEWFVQDKFAAVPLSDDPTNMNFGGPAMPTVPVICVKCGNTHFVNLLVLGFDLKELKFDDDAKPAQ